MSMTDPIADLLTRIRNAHLAGHESVKVPHSKVLEQITKIMGQEGFVGPYTVEEKHPCPVITIALKYQDDRTPVIRTIRRVSKPGCRVYSGAKEIPRVLNGLGVNILSTSHGIMTGRQARAEGVGGEILCEIY